MLEDVEAERHVLGALLLGNKAAAVEGVTLVAVEDFTLGRHRDTFEAIQALVGRGVRPDTPTVYDELDRRGHTPADGGVWLSQLTRTVGSTANLCHYAARVADLSRRRRVVDQAQRLAKAAADMQTTLDDVVASSVDELVTGRSASGIITVLDVAEDVRTLHQQGRGKRGLATGWSNVDRIWRPVPGQVTIVAGHPSSGKSSWVDALAVNMAAKHGARTAMWSPESSPTEDHTARLAALYDGTAFERISDDRLEHAMGWVHDKVVWVDHDAHDTVGSILAQVAAVHTRTPLRQFVLDPWTDLDNTRPRGMREDEHIAAELTKIRRFARRHNIHVVVVVHPRNLERNTDGTLKVPTPETFSGGSMWKRRADAIVVIWRDDTAAEPESAYVDVFVAKVRRNGVDGQMGRKTTLRFDVATGRYNPLLASVGEAV